MRIIRTILTIFLLVIITISAIFLVGFLNFKKGALYSKNKIISNAGAASDALKNLETKQARYSLQIVQKEIDLWLNKAGIFTRFIPQLKSIPQTIEKYSDLMASSIILTEKIDFLKNNGVQLVLQQKGGELISTLKDLQTEINKIADVAVNDRVYVAKAFLSATINWLASEEPQHFIVLFQNSSEIRPGGGFLGSFAQLTLKNGGLAHLEVNDIYDLDGQLTIKIEPPKALQSITTNWGARDANWFLDFPTSARKVIKFLEASRIFQDRNLRFSGMIAINDKVVVDLMRVIGPIENLTAENFLAEVQKEVETDASKNVLKEITPVIFERLNKLSGDRQKKQLLEIFANRFKHKDIMV